jgi:NitT/TauT family transport system substrate-binding protein
MKRQCILESFTLAALAGAMVFLIMTSDAARSHAAAPTAGAKPETNTLSIGVAVPALSYLPCWVADQKGFLKQEGFTEVKVLIFKGDSDVLQALTGGTIDLSVSSLTGVVEGIKSGQKFKAVWGGYNPPYFEWYAVPKFKSMAETKGGRFAVTKHGALTDFLTRYALRTVGIDPDKDVKILALGGSPQSIPAMEAGQIDVTILSVPANYVAAEKGFVKIMSMKESIAPDWPVHVVFAKETYIARNPNAVKAFLRASGRAIEWIRANPEEAAQIASKTAKFKVEYCRMYLQEYQDYWFADGRLPQKGMRIFWDLAIQAGDVTEAWPESKWLDRSFLDTQAQWRR